MKEEYINSVQVQRKVTLFSMASIATVLVLFLGVTIIFQVRMLQIGAVDHLEVLSEVISHLIPGDMDLEQWDDRSRILETLRADQDISLAVVYDRDGHVVTSYISPDSEVEIALPRWEPDAAYRFFWQEASLHLVLFSPVQRDGERVGGMALVATMLRAQRQIVVTALLLAVGAALFLLATHLAARRLERSITEAVSRLAATAQSIAELGDYSVRVARSGKNEIGGLIEHFNTMLDAIQVRDSELHQHRHNLELIVEERTEELRRRRDEALAVSQAKTEFLANMSHEIRTPMNGVIGVLSLLRDAPLSGEYRRLLETAGRSADSLMHIINDILDFSKIDAGMVEFEIIPFNVCDLVEEVTALYADAARSRRIDLLSYVTSNVQCQVAGDPTRLRQILTNLISNAVKFTERGQVFVKVEQIEIQNEKQLFRFAVSDTGIGIPEMLMPRLFEKFTQADGSITRHFGGTGLGLSVCKQLVELQGGDIGVYSREGDGTEFWFTLQYKMISPEPLPVPGELKGVTAMIVTRCEGVRMILESYLAGAGATVVACSDMDQALVQLDEALSQSRPFDLAIIGEHEAYCGGVSVSTLIQGSFVDRAPRLYLLTSGGVGEVEAIDRGFQAVLYQPIRRRHLIAVIAGHDPSPSARDEHYSCGTAQISLTGKVLLVDDEPINRNVACAILERFGLEVHTASQGREAVARAAQEDYDIILMDIQMPEMSGYEATELIRAQERKRLKQPGCIIAMTANALKSTRIRCLQAGMDDFISKPIKPDMLAARLRPWLAGNDGHLPLKEQAVEEPAEDANGPVWDRKQSLQLANGDESLLMDLVRLFLSRQEQLLDQVRQAVVAADPVRLDDAAHAYKGAVNHFCAVRVREAALELEMKGKNEDLSGIGELLELLELESAQLVEQLRIDVEAAA